MHNDYLLKGRQRSVMLVLLLFNLVALASASSDAETINFTEQGYANGKVISTVSGTYCTVTFDKGTGSNNPTYYTTGTAIRAYGGNTMTIASTTKTIVKVEITFGSGGNNNAITTNVGTYDNGSWTGSATSVTFTVGGTSGTNDNAAAVDICLGIGHDVTILTTAERRAIDAGIARDVHLGADDVGPCVEEYALVALACTEEVAGHGVSSNLCRGARHTKGGCSTKVHRAGAPYISIFITAINVGQYMATGNIHYSIAFYYAS